MRLCYKNCDTQNCDMWLGHAEMVKRATLSCILEAGHHSLSRNTKSKSCQDFKRSSNSVTGGGFQKYLRASFGEIDQHFTFTTATMKRYDESSVTMKIETDKMKILFQRNFYQAIWIFPVSHLSAWGDLFSDLFCANFAKYLLNICGREFPPLSASRRCHSSLPTKFRSGGRAAAAVLSTNRIRGDPGLDQSGCPGLVWGLNSC